MLILQEVYTQIKTNTFFSSYHQYSIPKALVKDMYNWISLKATL